MRANCGTNGSATSRVMGPAEEIFEVTPSFDGKRPPKWNGRNRSYEAWKEDIILWNELTDLESRKRAIAIIGQLDDEPKNLAKTLKTVDLCKDDGVKILLDFLDKSFALSADDRIDTDLMELLDWSIEGHSLTQFLGGFHTRIARIENTMSIPSKIQGLLLLRQANITGELRGRVLACTGGSIDVQDIMNALKKINLTNTS